MDAGKFLATCIGLVQGAGFDPFDLDQAPDFLKEKWKEEGQTEPFGRADLGTVEDDND